MLASYTRAINKQEGRTGSLFRQHTKAKNGWIDEFVTMDFRHEKLFFSPNNNYAYQCFQYIHQNPVKAGLVKKSEEWLYSSAPDYAKIRNGTLCNYRLSQKLILPEQV